MLATDESFGTEKWPKNTDSNNFSSLLYTLESFYRRKFRNLFVCLFLFVYLFVCPRTLHLWPQMCTSAAAKNCRRKNKTEGSFVASKCVCRDKKCGRLCNSVYVTSVCVAKNVQFVAADVHFDARQTCTIAATILKLWCQQFPMIDFTWL